MSFFGQPIDGFVPGAATTGPDARVFAFDGERLVLHRDEPARVPTLGELEAAGVPLPRTWPIGTLDGVACLAVALDAGVVLPAGLRSSTVRRLFGSLEPRLIFVGALGGQIAHFDQTTRFCGQCGQPTTVAAEPLTKRCNRCSRDLHPHVAPCVIVLVSDGPRVLLTRGPKFPPGMYGLVAGFVEPGETLEGCVVREVMEETGISITPPRYVASQPWPFPSQLMVGYVAERTGGEVRPDPSELEDAKFFGPDELPMLPPPLSIARRLLDSFLAGTLPGATPGPET